MKNQTGRVTSITISLGLGYLWLEFVPPNTYGKRIAVETDSEDAISVDGKTATVAELMTWIALREHAFVTVHPDARQYGASGRTEFFSEDPAL